MGEASRPPIRMDDQAVLQGQPYQILQVSPEGAFFRSKRCVVRYLLNQGRLSEVQLFQSSTISTKRTLLQVNNKIDIIASFCRDLNDVTLAFDET